MCPIEAPDLEPDPSNPTDRSRIVWDVLGFEPLPFASKRTVSQWTLTLGNSFLFSELWVPIRDSHQRIERTRATRVIPRVCDVRVRACPRVRTPGGVSGGSCVLSLGLGCTPLLNSLAVYPVWVATGVAPASSTLSRIDPLDITHTPLEAAKRTGHEAWGHSSGCTTA